MWLLALALNKFSKQPKDSNEFDRPIQYYMICAVIVGLSLLIDLFTSPNLAQSGWATAVVFTCPLLSLTACRSKAP